MAGETLLAGSVDMSGFFQNTCPTLTVMVQAETPERIKELMDQSIPCGAEAFGIQLEQLNPEYRTEQVYRELFSYAASQPSYVTNYRNNKNEGKTDDQLADELLEAAKCGAELCDVMGDCFDKQDDEMAVDPNAIEKQIALIKQLHSRGAKVLMSSHIMKFTPAERVLEIALEQQRRGADICKIVTGADTMDEQLDNLKIIHMLKKELKIPFLFLSVGECRLLRRIGGLLGCCMYLCVYEQDAFSTPVQPLLEDVRVLREKL